MAQNNTSEEQAQDQIINEPMQVKTISVEYTRKINLGDYESVALGATAWADLAEDADPDAALMELADLVKLNVAKRATKYFRIGGEKIVKQSDILQSIGDTAAGKMPRL